MQIIIEDYGKKIIAAPGDRLLPLLQEHGISVSAPCGGGGRCGKCRILVVEGEQPVTPEDRHFLSKEELSCGVRLACAARVDSDLRIRILKKEKAKIHAISDSIDREQARVFEKDTYYVAVDIGTTTLAACLYGANAFGEPVKITVTGTNRGAVFGADILSRIEASSQGKRARLQQLLQEDVSALLEALCDKAQIKKKDIDRIVLAANQTMVHLLMGYSCELLGRAPFSSEHTNWIHGDALRVLGAADYHCPVDILPAVSAFVGGDIVSGMLALGLDKAEETRLFIDIGTNSEMVLLHSGQTFVTSAAAGPALEGGGISCGCASITGAVSEVRLVDKRLVSNTIAHAPAIGICGSGVISLVHILRRLKVIDETGLFTDEEHRLHGFAFAKDVSGEPITFTQADVRAFQLAKAAIRTGIELLLAQAHVKPQDVARIDLAGGFGAAIDTEAAKATGMLPEEFGGRMYAVGNTSLGGCICAAVDADISTRIQSLLERSHTLLLAEQPQFQENYLKYINL